MEKITPHQDDRLLDYLDGRLEGTGLKQLREELENSPGMQARLDELRLIHRTMAMSKLESPSPAFTQNVMRNLHTGSSPSVLSPRNGLLLVAGVITAAGILVAMVSAGIFDQISGLISIQEPVPIQKYIQQPLPSLPVSGRVIMNVMVGMALILVFFVLDRTVLRPIFQRRAGLQL